MNCLRYFELLVFVYRVRDDIYLSCSSYFGLWGHPVFTSIKYNWLNGCINKGLSICWQFFLQTYIKIAEVYTTTFLLYLLNFQFLRVFLSDGMTVNPRYVYCFHYFDFLSLKVKFKFPYSCSLFVKKRKTLLLIKRYLLQIDSINPKMPITTS